MSAELRVALACTNCGKPAAVVDAAKLPANIAGMLPGLMMIAGVKMPSDIDLTMQGDCVLGMKPGVLGELLHLECAKCAGVANG